MAATKKQQQLQRQAAQRRTCMHSATMTVHYASGPGTVYVLTKWCLACGSLGQTLGRTVRGREVVPVTEWTKPAFLVDRPLKGKVKR